MHLKPCHLPRVIDGDEKKLQRVSYTQEVNAVREIVRSELGWETGLPVGGKAKKDGHPKFSPI